MERRLCLVVPSWRFSEVLSLSRRTSGDFGRVACDRASLVALPQSPGGQRGAPGTRWERLFSSRAVTSRAAISALLAVPRVEQQPGECVPGNEPQEFPSQGSDCSRAEQSPCSGWFSFSH